MKRTIMTAICFGLMIGTAWSAEPGTLTVSCGRGEYKVEVDGLVKGKCGENISLAPGSHKVRVAKRGNAGEELYLQQVTIEEKKTLALTAEFKKASELDDSIGTAQFPPQKALNEMQAIDRKIKQIREQFRNDLKNGINKIVAEKNSRYLKLANARKDEFESEGEFTARVTKEKAALDKEQAAEFTNLQNRFEADYEKQISPLIEELKKISGQEFTITAENLTLELGVYNAETNSFPVSIKGKKPLGIVIEEGKRIVREAKPAAAAPASAKKQAKKAIKKKGLEEALAAPLAPVAETIVQEPPKMKYIMLAANADIPLPRDEARVFKQHFANNMLRAELTGNFETPENFTIAAAKIIDDATVKSYSLFTSTFVDLGNGTIYDSTTKLIWSKDGNPGRSELNWDAANNYVAHLNKTAYMGFCDWRLPSKENLESLVSHAKQAGYGSGERTIARYLSLQSFVTVAIDYWSSSLGDKGYAWSVDMKDGNGGSDFRNDHHFNMSTSFLWPVRGGQ